MLGCLQRRYQYRGYGLSMGTMITGWDKTGPQVRRQ